MMMMTIEGKRTPLGHPCLRAFGMEVEGQNGEINYPRILNVTITSYPREIRMEAEGKRLRSKIAREKHNANTDTLPPWLNNA